MPTKPIGLPLYHSLTSSLQKANPFCSNPHLPHLRKISLLLSLVFLSRLPLSKIPALLLSSLIWFFFSQAKPSSQKNISPLLPGKTPFSSLLQLCSSPTLPPACTNGQQIFSELPLQVSTPDCSSNSTIVIL